MALSGVHVACVNINLSNGASLIGKVSWSQTMTAAGTTASSAPNDRNMSFEISAAADAYVATGATPDAAAGPRVLVRAGETRQTRLGGGLSHGDARASEVASPARAWAE
jgi:hypothetical protein